MTTFEERIAEIEAERKAVSDRLFKELEENHEAWGRAVAETMYEYRPRNAIIERLQNGSFLTGFSDDFESYIELDGDSLGDLQDDFELAEAGGFIQDTWTSNNVYHPYVLTETGKRYPERVTTADGEAGSA